MVGLVEFGEGEGGGGGVLLVENLEEACDTFGVGGGEVVLFTGIVGEVIEFSAGLEFGVGGSIPILADEFPGT